MRLSIVLLAVILFLQGLAYLGAASIPGHVMGWMLIVDAVLFLLEPVIPAIPWPVRRAE